MGRGQVCAAAPAAGSTGLLLQFYYCTGWRPAVLHYQQQLRDSNGPQQPWEEKPMQWCGEEEMQQPDWQACELLLHHNIERLEFVCCSADHREWDNAPADEKGSEKKNYVICFSASPSSHCSSSSPAAVERGTQETPPDLMPQAARVPEDQLTCCCSSARNSGSSADSSSNSVGHSSSREERNSKGKSQGCGRNKGKTEDCCSNKGKSEDCGRNKGKSEDCCCSNGTSQSLSNGPAGGSCSPPSGIEAHRRSSSRGGRCSCRACVERIVCVLVDGQLAVVQGPRCLLIADLDGTLIGNSAYLSQFISHWKLRHLWRGSKLVYNTGRNVKDFLFAAGCNGLLRPDYAILGVGTEVYQFSPGKEQKNGNRIEDWLLNDQERQQFKEDIAFSSPEWPAWCSTRTRAVLSSTWLERLGRRTFDRRSLACAAAENLPGCFVNGNIFYDPFRISLSVPAVLVEAAQQQQHQGQEQQVETKNAGHVCDSSEADERKQAVTYLVQLFNSSLIKTCVSGQGEWRFVDLLPLNGGKLTGSLFVMEELGFATSETVVAGDSGNDAEMFLCPQFCGICVRNAQPDFVAFLQQQVSCLSDVSAEKERATQEAPGKDVAVAGRTGAAGSEERQQKLQRARKQDTRTVCRVYFAKHDCAGGVLEGLVHFGFDAKASIQL